MPAIYWLPLPGLTRASKVEHVHAALSRWFDGDDGHAAKVKPYRLAPPSRRDGLWGVEVSLLTLNALNLFTAALDNDPVLRLGSHITPVGDPEVLHGASWDDLADWPGEAGWEVTFLSPFAFRTGNRTSPFPAFAVVLRAPTVAWERFSERPPLRITPAQQTHLWVPSVEIHTTTFQLNGRSYPGALGTITYRADDPDVARTASSLFRLATYCGMGSFRGKGMGVVVVRPV